MTLFLSLLEAIVAIPKIGDLIERAIKAMSQHLSERRLRASQKTIEEATDLTNRALTKDEKLAALRRWHNL